MITDTDESELTFSHAIIPIRLMDRITSAITRNSQTFDLKLNELNAKKENGTNVDAEIDELLADKSNLMKFYVLRSFTKNRVFGDKYVGVIYAAEMGGEKIYFKDDADAAVKRLARAVSLRISIIKNPITVAVVLPFGGAFIMAILGFIFGSGLFALMLIVLGIGVWCYFLFFPLIKIREYAGVQILEDTMRNEGFSAISPKIAAIGKY